MRYLSVALALLVAVPVSAQAPEVDAGWHFVAAQDSITGEDKSDARLVKEPYFVSFGCSADSLTFTVITWTKEGDVLMGLDQTDEARVSWHVDKAEGEPFRAKAGTASVSASGDVIRELAEQVASGQELMLRVRLSNGAEAAFADTFSLDGSSRVLNQLSCFP